MAVSLSNKSFKSPFLTACFESDGNCSVVARLVISEEDTIKIVLTEISYSTVYLNPRANEKSSDQ